MTICRFGRQLLLPARVLLVLHHERVDSRFQDLSNAPDVFTSFKNQARFIAKFSLLGRLSLKVEPEMAARVNEASRTAERFSISGPQPCEERSRFPSRPCAHKAGIPSTALSDGAGAEFVPGQEERQEPHGCQVGWGDRQTTMK